MVVAKLRIAVEDPLVAERCGFAPENVMTGDEPFFLDGPVAARIAIIDRNPSTGQLAEPVKWLPKRRTFSVPDDISSPQGIAVSVFGIVLETMSLFERKDVLGHKVKWAFGSPQLLIVPRAGIWANAFYDRYSRSLRCFSFIEPGGALIHTALSRDIVAHETGHAILDGLAPALYDALTPQSLALHEAIGDFTAIVMALQSRQIRDWLVREYDGKLVGSTPVCQLACQFGESLGMNRPLRDANNSLNIKDVTDEPHELCQVLCGAFWSAMTQLHNSSMVKAQKADDKSKEEPVGKALAISALRIGRILFRALDYLPPAEVTFADYCRAVLRSDEIAYQKDETGYREVLKQEFVKRGIVDSLDELEPERGEQRIKVNLDNILESDWAAYDFANRERKLLNIPPGVPFRLFPRRNVVRRYYLGQGKHEDRREIVFQLTWERPEDNRGIRSLPGKRGVFQGTTLVLGDSGDARGRYPVLSCLTSDKSDDQEKTRNGYVQRLAGQGQLAIGEKWQTFSTQPLAPEVFGRVTDNILRLRGTARLLHLARDDSWPKNW